MENMKIQVNLGDKIKISLMLNPNNLLSETRKKLFDEIEIPFKYGDQHKNYIPKEKESEIKLKDILDGSNLYLIKDMIKRVMLGRKIETKNGLDFYLYPQRKLTEEEKNSSLNIMVIGETGSGKSTWLQCLLNYLQEIQLEEDERYYLFDEKALLNEYQNKNGSKFPSFSIIEKPTIYNIEPNKLFNKPIRLIDTPGFDDVRGLEYEKKMIEDIRNLFQSSEIKSINTICFFFKANQGRARGWFLPHILSLFNNEIKNNVVFIFTFTTNFNDIPCLKGIQYKDGPFDQMFEDIKKIPYFAFDSSAYFIDDIDDKKFVEEMYENNTTNFRNFLQCVSSFNRVSLKSS